MAMDPILIPLMKSEKIMKTGTMRVTKASRLFLRVGGRQRP